VTAPPGSAVCHRCGADKAGPFVPCKACGFTPTGDDRAIAWLFSTHHLTEAELEVARARVLNGVRPDPSKALKDAARDQMGAAPLDEEARRPFPPSTLALLALVDVVLTPLAGYAVWLGLRTKRPRAAKQALFVTLPISIVLLVLWMGAVYSGVSG
jgi:hypothetical protein